MRSKRAHALPSCLTILSCRWRHHQKYLLLSNSHDGSGSVQIKFTPTRLVCHNTLTMALQGGDTAIRVRIPAISRNGWEWHGQISSSSRRRTSR
ncbi:MAG: DUF932 domain-containing protein [Candidatus Solibacter sp.]